MRTLAVISALLLAAAAGQGNGPVKPEKPLDPEDPRSVALHLTYNTRSQKSYETTFRAKIAPPRGDAIQYQGRCVWVRPGVVFIHYTASGGDEKNIVRAGERVWVHHPFAGWTPAEEMGLNGAARGIQNPDEVLAVLSRHLDGARLDGPGVVTLAFTGKDIQDVMREQAQRGAFDWKESSAALTLHAGDDGRLKKFACDAALKSTDPNVDGRVKYTAEVVIVSYNKAERLAFVDEEKKAIALDDGIKQAIDTVRKEKN